MSVIKWRDSYNTGVEQFDKEHHKIVELINEMFLAMRDKAGQDQVEKLLNEVVSYAGYHFDNEEKAMAESNFEELETHRQEHEKLKEETERFHGLLEEDFNNGTKIFYKFLREWLTNHILDCDMKYSGKI